MIHTPCPLCLSVASELLYTKQEMRVVRCALCGVAYVNPRLTQPAQEELYASQAISPTSYYTHEFRYDRRTFRSRLRLLHHYSRPPGCLLDLGSGVGAFAVAAREYGWHPIVVDCNLDSVKECWERGLVVRHGVYPYSVRLEKDAPFDVIVMNDFLEHLADPLTGLKTARELLTPTGTLMLSTPDIGSFLAWLLGKHWIHLKPREHLVYFDRRTLTAALQIAGFEVLEIAVATRVHSLGTAVEKAAAYAPRLSRVASRALPQWVKRIGVPFKFCDEMLVIARPV